MTKRLTLYIQEGHASVTVDNGVSRQTTAPTVPAMLAGMPEGDRAILNEFCRIVLDVPPVATVTVPPVHDTARKPRLWGR